MPLCVARVSHQAKDQPLDDILFATDLVTIGAFRCPIGHPRFRNSGPIRQPCVVFPRTAVEIEHEGRRPFLGDPTRITLYNQGQRYERRVVGSEGDRCDWFAVTPDVARDIVRETDAAAADHERPIRSAVTRSHAALYLRQRHLFNRVKRGHAIDRLSVEEEVLALVREVLAQAATEAETSRTRDEPRRNRRRELVAAAERLLAARFREPLTLGVIAGSLGASPFHLARSFRELTGLTLHGYRAQLRLRSALEPVEAGADLTRIALDSGYSSHSHFTESFRHTFGAPPSEWRATF
jgi:AraC family transcriptional regulator